MEGTIEYVMPQAIGGAVDYANELRMTEYIKNIRFQDYNLEGAINELNKARDFIGTPEHILGSAVTKHGEVAEVLDVRFGNADKIICGHDPNYSFDGVGRTAAEDYLKNNLPVQSKFVQSNLSMDAVLNHLDKYPDFVNGGGSYCIPKDYYEQIQVWSKMSSEELQKLPASEGGRVARNVMERVRELEEKTGKSFGELVEPSQLEYNQVQLNRADGTIDIKEQEIIEVDSERREEYWKMAKASVKEGFKMAAISAAISGVISFAVSLIDTLKSSKKKLNELTQNDWKEIFKQTGIDSVKGGVSGGAIYVLTNAAGMSGPFAAALVSAILGIASQAIKLGKREISFDDFMYNMVNVSVETAISGVGAAIGQAIIPVPVLGAIVGSLVASTVLSIIKKYVFGGGYYELVKKASYEKAYSDEYKSLTNAFNESSNMFDKSLLEYSHNINLFRSRRNGSKLDMDVDLNQTLNEILTT